MFIELHTPNGLPGSGNPHIINADKITHVYGDPCKVVARGAAVLLVTETYEQVMDLLATASTVLYLDDNDKIRAHRPPDKGA